MYSNSCELWLQEMLTQVCFLGAVLSLPLSCKLSFLCCGGDQLFLCGQRLLKPILSWLWKCPKSAAFNFCCLPFKDGEVDHCCEVASIIVGILRWDCSSLLLSWFKVLGDKALAYEC